LALKFSTGVSPSGIAVDVQQTTTTFSMKINGGTCYGYNIFITTTDNVTVLDSSVVGLSTPKYDGEILEIAQNLSSLDYGETYKWHVNLYTNVGLTTFITDTSYIFYSDTPPTLDYLAGNPLAAPSGASPNKFYDVNGAIFEVRGTYAQDENIGVKSWYFSIYNDLQQLITQFSPTHDTNIVKEFTGLETGRTFWIEFTVETENEYLKTSERIQLVVDYENVPSTITPTATFDSETSGATVEWGGSLVYIIGTTSSPPTFFSAGSENYIQPNADIEFIGFEAVSEFNFYMEWGNVNTAIDGDLVVLENTTTSEILTIVYDNGLAQFELYYSTTLIDSVSFGAPASGVGSWLVFVDLATNGLVNSTLKITTGV
jgi:hypothetical protein